MKKGKKWLLPAVMLAVAISCSFGTDISGTLSTDMSSGKRADVITIDSMAVFGRLEKRPVAFLHDAHTKALAGKNKDCSVCHLSQNNRIYPKFKRFEDTDRIEVMNIYHQACISCHGEMKLAKEKAGPVKCGGCHTVTEKYLSSRQPFGFDQSLHYRHSLMNGNQCEKCHHQYSEAKKALYYEKGKEGTCRYCHRDTTEANRISMRQASHLACINCHINPPVQTKVKPPLTCTGCHDPVERQKIKKLTGVPRMERNQPDRVLLKSASKSLRPDEKKNRMPLVPFDHQAHEAANDNCRACHHAGMQRCAECHTPYGNPVGPEDSKGVILERAMHQTDAMQSCLGCHRANTQDKNCAGCHAFMSPKRKKQEATCLKCHSVPVQTLQPSSTAEEESRLVRSMLQPKKRMAEAYRLEDLPEKVTIRLLSKEYKAVTFPHRQIVTALVEKIKDNPLAGFFHNGIETVCQGCHHHSPASPKPPQCSNCHLDQWDLTIPLKPGILAAYHQQCMGCHAQMKIEKPAGCTECHQAKHPE